MSSIENPIQENRIIEKENKSSEEDKTSDQKNKEIENSSSEYDVNFNLSQQTQEDDKKEESYPDDEESPNSIIDSNEFFQKESDISKHFQLLEESPQEDSDMKRIQQIGSFSTHSAALSKSFDEKLSLSNGQSSSSKVGVAHPVNTPISEIFGVDRNFRNDLIFTVRFEGCSEPEKVSNFDMKKFHQQALINFYESHISFGNKMEMPPYKRHYE